LKEICYDLVKTATSNLEPDDEWRIELFDQDHKPRFIIRLAGQAVEL